MWTFSLARSLGLLAATGTFLLLRLAAHLAMVVAFAIGVTVGAGLGWGIGHVGDADLVHGATLWGGVAGFALVALCLWWIREYLLYLLTAGHIAAMVTVLDGGRLPSGRAQIDLALATVHQRFGEVTLLFVLDQLVKGAVGAVTGLLQQITTFMGVPGLSGAARLVEMVIRLSTTFVDELVLARQIHIASDDPWTTAREGIVLYAQSARAILINAVWLMVMRWGLTIVLALVLVGPAAVIVFLVPGPTTAWTLVFALLLALAVQRSVIDPFCVASLIQVYFAETDGRRPDADWDRQIAEVSRPFRELIARAG
jgi:hypothetical protein